LLELLGDDVSWWLLDFQRSCLTVEGHAGRRLFGVRLPYDRIGDVFCRRCQEEVGGRGVVHCHLPHGARTAVCAGTAEESMEIINLVWVAATRCLPVAGAGAAPALTLRDADLEAFLARRYADRPGVVAEAVRALRKGGKEFDAWLVHVLRGRELSGLWAAVRRELHGGAEGGE
jgi:hypothetical protein